MAHVYEVHLSNGRIHQVTMPRHHSEYSNSREFEQAVQRIVENTISQVISGSILRIVHKGRG